jgi:2,4-didehydro-3-deoxy-L-rhamnonate hydrolase
LKKLEKHSSSYGHVFVFEVERRAVVRQNANTRDLIIDVPGLIAFATQFYSLMPGDVLLTGTPEGVGPIKPGDVIQSEISRIEAMTTTVRANS